jgi:hypothetical protein
LHGFDETQQNKRGFKIQKNNIVLLSEFITRITIEYKQTKNKNTACLSSIETPISLILLPWDPKGILE